MRNFILSIFSALFLSFIVAGAQESPIPGTYFIVSSILSSAGDRLAVTFQGNGSEVTVTPLTDSGPASEAQRWIISDLNTNDAQAVIPVTAPSEAAAVGDNTVVVLPKNGFVWTIRNITSEYFTIEFPEFQFWSLNNAVDNSNIVLGLNMGSPAENWVLDLIE